MKVLDKVVFSKTEPPMTNVLWIKPVQGGIAFYLFDDGRWKTANIVNDMGTPSTDDDEVADISNIPQIVQQEVATQMEGHDESVSDTHNTESSDTNDYPDVLLF